MKLKIISEMKVNYVLKSVSVYLCLPFYGFYGPSLPDSNE